MQRKLRFTPTASEQLSALESDPSARGVLRQVGKTLGYLETNPQAKSLQSHEFKSLTMRYGEKVFEAYVQQDTPGAYRVFWRYGPDQKDSSGKRLAAITIIAIVPHPE